MPLPVQLDALEFVLFRYLPDHLQPMFPNSLMSVVVGGREPGGRLAAQQQVGVVPLEPRHVGQVAVLIVHPEGEEHVDPMLPRPIDGGLVGVFPPGDHRPGRGDGPPLHLVLAPPTLRFSLKLEHVGRVEGGAAGRAVPEEAVDRQVPEPAVEQVDEVPPTHRHFLLA